MSAFIIYTMNKSIPLYSILSFLSFYIIQISSQTYFAIFGIFLYIASGIALLGYLESIDRNKKSDIISVIIYIFLALLFFILPFVSQNFQGSGISINTNNIKIYWMPLYIITIFLPIYILYKNRLKFRPLYIPILLSAIIPAWIIGLLLILLPDMRNNAISNVSDIIQVSIIDGLIKMKETMKLPEDYANMLSYLTLNKDIVAKQMIFMIPAAISCLFILITYMSDRLKPIVKDNILIIRDYYLPDNLVWLLIIGGFLILAPSDGLKYISYNVLSIFAVLYFFQGLQIINRAFSKFQISFFFRFLLLLFIFLYFIMFATIVILIGIFSIWFKPKWLQDDKGNTDNKGDIDKKEDNING